MFTLGASPPEGSTWGVYVVIAVTLVVVIAVTLAVWSHIIQTRNNRNNYRHIPPPQRRGLL